MITVTMLDQRDGGNNPRDFDMKVIQLPDGETPVSAKLVFKHWIYIGYCEALN